MTAPDTIARMHYSVNEWCRLHSIGRSKFYEMVRAGQIKIVKCGRKTLVPAGQSPAHASAHVSGPDRGAQGSMEAH